MGEKLKMEKDLIHGKLEHMMETASRIAGLTEKQYEEWRKQKS